MVCAISRDVFCISGDGSLYLARGYLLLRKCLGVSHEIEFTSQEMFVWNDDSVSLEMPDISIKLNNRCYGKKNPGYLMVTGMHEKK